MAEQSEVPSPAAPQPHTRTAPFGRFSRELIAGYLYGRDGAEVGRSAGVPLERDSGPEDATRREIVFIVGSRTEVLFGSAALFPALGFEPHELRGTPLVELMNRPEAQDLVAFLETIDPRSERPARLRMEMHHKEGSACVLVGSVTAIFEEGFGRSYVIRVRMAAFQGNAEQSPETGLGTFFRKARFDSR